MNARWLAPPTIVVLGLLAYANSFNVPFIFDDVNGIVENPSIRVLWPASVPLSPPAQTAVAGRPAVNLTFALNYAAGALNPAGYHAVNLAIHLLAALALYGIVRRTLTGCPVVARYATSAEWSALVAALLWAVHPLQTESVTYVVKRNESMMGLCYLLTLYCFMRGSNVDGSSAGAARASAAWFTGAVLICAIGMATKEVMATAPLIVLLYDRVFLVRSWGESLRRRAAVHAGLFATWGVLGALVASAPRSVTTGFDLPDVSWQAYALTQSGVIVHYLRLTVIPWPQCLDYGWPIVTGFRDVLLSGAAILLLLGVGVWAIRRRPPLGYLIAWFFVTLAPSSSILPIREICCEYRMYLPLAAICVLVAVGGGELLRQIVGNAATVRALQIGASVLMVTALTTLTLMRNNDYRSVESIWTDTVAKRPDNPRSRNLLANTLSRKGDLDAALPHYRRALELDPNYVPAHTGMANALAMRGDNDGAIEHNRRALELRPNYFPGHINLGKLLEMRGDLEAAAELYERATRLRPDSVLARVELGNVLIRLDRSGEALVQFREALRLDPNNATARRAVQALGP